jgi:hypothetical protein
VLHVTMRVLPRAQSLRLVVGVSSVGRHQFPPSSSWSSAPADAGIPDVVGAATSAGRWLSGPLRRRPRSPS